MGYKICKGQLPILGGIAAHNAIVVLDDNDNVIAEFNGLATKFDRNNWPPKSELELSSNLPSARLGSYNGLVKPIGYKPSDRLVVYEDSKGYFQHEDSRNKLEHLTCVYEGSKEEIEYYMERMRKAAHELNNRDLHYPVLGIFDVTWPLNDGWAVNSNSIVSTLLAAAGLDDPNLSWSLTPGQGKVLLSREEIQDIYCSTRTPAERVFEKNLAQQEEALSRVPKSEFECGFGRNLEASIDYSRSRQGSALQWEDWPQEKQPDNAQPADQPYRPPLPDTEPKLPEPWSIDPF
jgi:hypothetical protein